MTPWFLAPDIIPFINLRKKQGHHEMRFEKGSRYYVIRLGKDLFDDWVVTLVNGQIKSKLGQIRNAPFNSFEEGFEHFCSQAKLRHQRGYLLKNIACDNHLTLHLLPFLRGVQKIESSKPVLKRAGPRKSRKTNRIMPAQPSPQQLAFLF